MIEERPVRPAGVRRRGARAAATPRRRGRPRTRRGDRGGRPRRPRSRGSGARKSIARRSASGARRRSTGAGRDAGHAAHGRARIGRRPRSVVGDAAPRAGRRARPSAGYAAQTASDRTVRSRPDSSSWSAAARRPAGRGDHVPQLGRVHRRLLGEERAALERLDDEVVGDVAREAEVDGRVDERLHDEEDVGRAGAARPRSPSRPSSRRRPRAGRRGRRAGPPPGRAAPSVVSGVAYQTVMPLPRRAGVFGMLRTTWSWPSVPIEGRRRRAGEDAQDELAAAQVRADLAADLGRASGA